MHRPFLFMSGEFAVSMPLVFATEDWEHTMSAKLVFDSGRLRRHNRFDDDVKGVVHFADYDASVASQNLQKIVTAGVPCWPDPKTMLRMLDRHDVMRECVQANLVSHRVIVTDTLCERDVREFEFPFVVKTGNDHRGINKHLCESTSDTLVLLGQRATVEPFFGGRSVRVFLAGDAAFGVNVTNSSSWIKNSPGATAEPCELDPTLVSHAIEVVRLFDLDVAGVDYIVSDDSFHFLEVNQYPGPSPTDEVAAHMREVFKDRMDRVKSSART